MEIVNRWRSFLFLLLLSPAISTGQTAEPLKVLFVGNSYTNHHNLPEIVAQLAHAKGKRLYYEMIAPGGKNFEAHWQAGNAQTAIEQKDWDVVVLQNQSFEPVGDPEQMFDYGQRFATAVAKTDAELCFYLTWAYANETVFQRKQQGSANTSSKLQTMQTDLNRSYFALANKVGASVSPVGIAWEIVRREHPEVELHASDGSHPNHRGAYLSGLVMYSVLFEDTAESMPETLHPYFHSWRKHLWGQELKVTIEERDILEAAANRAVKISREQMHPL